MGLPRGDGDPVICDRAGDVGSGDMDTDFCDGDFGEVGLVAMASASWTRGRVVARRAPT